MKRYSWFVKIEDYAPLIGDGAFERILHKAHRPLDLRVLHLSSTFYGGGVAEMLSSPTLSARSLGIKADWRPIQGSPDFFNVTKKIHNALQGADINLAGAETAEASATRSGTASTVIWLPPSRRRNASCRCFGNRRYGNRSRVARMIPCAGGFS